MANEVIRVTAREKGVFLWEVAQSLGVSEATITRRLRNELSEPERIILLDHISKVAEEKAANG